MKAVFFSPTGTTQKVVVRLSERLSELLHSRLEIIDFTLPEARLVPLVLSPADIIVFGTPVYAGRVPNLIAKYLSSMRADGAQAVAVSVYGNRDFDDALIETADILKNAGATVIAAASAIGEHSFSYTLAKNRPDNADLSLIDSFASKIAQKILNNDTSTPQIKGVPFPYRQHFQPKNDDGQTFDFRKIKPTTTDNCTHCHLCAEICPMGAINQTNTDIIDGICIKCGACIKKCPHHAKIFSDPNYIFHLRDIEQKCQTRKEPELFL